MSDIENYRILLELRSLFKQVNQVSWNVNSLEKRYPVESVTEEETNSMIKAYVEYIDWLDNALFNLKEVKKGLALEEKV